MMNNYTLIFNGEECVGNNVSNVVYVWTQNDKPCYVGYTTQNVFSRIKSHLKYQTGCFFQRKLRKYKNTFKCYIVYSSSILSELKQKEIEFIKIFNTFKDDNKNGYNLTRGGNEYTEQSIYTKNKRSKSLMGHVVSVETREKIKIGHTGKKYSQDRIKQMSNTTRLTHLIKWLEKEAPWFC